MRHNKRRKTRSNRRRGNASSSRRYSLIAGIVLAPICVLGLGGVLLKNELKKEKIDSDTYCYEQEQQHHAAFFIDYSLNLNGLSSVERSLANSLKSAYRSLPPNGKLSIFNTARNNNSDIVEPAFILCRPAMNVKEQKTINAVEETNEFIKRRYEEAESTFVTHVDTMMEEIKRGSEQLDYVPLLERFQGISRFYQEQPLQTLFVYTHGIQYSGFAEFCFKKDHLPPFSIFKSGNTYQTLKPTSAFKNVDVRFLLLEFVKLPTRKAPYCTNREIRAFWPAYFKHHGAKVELSILKGYQHD